MKLILLTLLVFAGCEGPKTSLSVQRKPVQTQQQTIYIWGQPGQLVTNHYTNLIIFQGIVTNITTQP
jgi:hypothetical protein